jgi:hypothetical protein
VDIEFSAAHYPSGMNYLNVAGVIAGPRLSIGAMTVYSGHLSLVRNTGFKGVVRSTDRQTVTFFVPESDPFTTSPTKTWLEISLRRIRSMGNPTMTYFGAYDEQVDVAADPRGGEHRWLQVSLQIPLTSVEEIELNYRVTVQA